MSIKQRLTNLTVAILPVAVNKTDTKSKTDTSLKTKVVGETATMSAYHAAA
jgi:hypothetical protein